nr:GNAT family N-acetyltransferase [Desulforamulus hydrothermalis]
MADYDGNIVGVIGMERSGTSVLLRSLAVSVDRRKSGIATALVNKALERAIQTGGNTAYLLTNTAATYMARWDFTKIERSEIPESLLQKSALNCACYDSICMKLDLL